MQFLTPFAVLVAGAMAAQVTIHNRCTTSIWLKPDNAASTGTPIAIPPVVAWVTDLKGTGNAFKLASTKASLAAPIQFDYTVNDADGLTYYDVTDGVGHPFDVMAHGDGECPVVACPGLCKSTVACASDKSIHVYACP